MVHLKLSNDKEIHEFLEYLNKNPNTKRFFMPTSDKLEKTSSNIIAERGEEKENQNKYLLTFLIFFISSIIVLKTL